jgi:hypothetical protein
VKRQRFNHEVERFGEEAKVWPINKEVLSIDRRLAKKM